MNPAQPWLQSFPESLRSYQLDPAVAQGNAADIASKQARLRGDRTAFTLVLPNGMNQSLTFRQADELSDAFAAYLSKVLGLQAGEVIAIQLPNSLHYPVAVLGAWKAGLIVTNVNPLYTQPELEHQLRDSGARVLLASDLFIKDAQPVVEKLGVRLLVASLGDFFPFWVGWLIKRKLAKDTTLPRIAHTHFMEALRQGRKSGAPERRRHAMALYQYTGGTTGRSKGTLLTHANLLATLDMAGSMLKANGIEFDEQDSMLTLVPMYHIFAFTFNFLLVMSHGGRNLLIPNPRPLDNVKAALSKFKISLMTGVDTLYAGLLSQPWFVAKPPALKMAISGGTALRPSTAEQWQKQVSMIVEGYGLTESSCFVSFNPPNERCRPGTVGLPLPGLEIRIIDENGVDQGIDQPGELLVRGPNITSGYLNREEDSREAFLDGWFCTGDIAQMDADGYLRIVDRKKDMILVSGFNVYPNEVEAAISEHPDVLEVAVVGVEDASTGEAVRAFITARTPSLTSDQVIQHCRQRMTGYKVPKQIIFLEQLPKSPVGKILRAELRKRA